MTHVVAQVPFGGSLQEYCERRMAPRLVLRAPVSAARGHGRYAAILGGSLTFGQGVARPYPALLEGALGHPVINLGCRNAGVDAVLGDRAVLGLAAGSAQVVVQITGAQALSNPFYRVHPRRNDRLIGPTEALRRLYPQIDFAPFAFTGHLLEALVAAEDGAQGQRFALVVAGLRATWMDRMRALLRALGPGRATLLWVGTPPMHGAQTPCWPAANPAFVTGAMIDALRPLPARLVVVQPGHAAGMPGAQSQLHRRLAETLAPLLQPVLQH